MSDDKVPAWAEATEHRIITEVGKAIADTRADLSKAIGDSEARLRAEMKRRFDEVRDDLTVVMSRADRAHDRVEQEHQEVNALRAELSKVWRRLRDLEHRLGLNGGQGEAQP